MWRAHQVAEPSCRSASVDLRTDRTGRVVTSGLYRVIRLLLVSSWCPARYVVYGQHLGVCIRLDVLVLAAVGGHAPSEFFLGLYDQRGGISCACHRPDGVCTPWPNNTASASGPWPCAGSTPPPAASTSSRCPAGPPAR